MVEYAFKNDTRLTNYYPDSPLVLPNGLRFLNAEAAYHSEKFSEMSIKRLFCNLSPDDAKHLARELAEQSVPNFYETKAYKAMSVVVECKFTQNLDCMTELLESPGLYLVEDTTGWHDMRWGRCSCPKCFGKPYTNWLGKILTDLRARYRKEEPCY